MRIELSPARQRALAIGIAVACVLVVLVFAVWPMWGSWAEHADRVGLLKRQALTMQGLGEAAPRFEAAAKKLAADPLIQQLTFVAPQPALAIAQLQGQMSQVAAGASAVVTSSQPLPEARQGALTKITLQTMLEADVKALVKLLHSIESARPLLKVEKLVVRDPDGDWAVAPQGAAPNKLQVEIVLSANMRAP